MLATLVTYERPRWAAAIVQHLLEEPGVDTVAVMDNSSNYGDHQVRSSRLVVLDRGKNLGGGLGRNHLLKQRKPGEPFIRIDDDWVPRKHGWVQAALDVIARHRCGVVRLEPQMEQGETHPRPLDGNGPIWVVSGECADALGYFYTGFGKTLLDDLEYARRVVEWGHRRQGRVPGLLDMGWPIRDFCSETSTPGRPWLAPKALFLERARQINRRKFNLYVRFKQQQPGWEQRKAGLSDSETHDGTGVKWV